MIRQAILALVLVLVVGLWLAFVVWAILKATPVIAEAVAVAGLMARRREALERAEGAAPSLDDAEQILALTKELRARTKADPLRALDFELEAAEIALLAVRRGDLDRARRSLRRIGRQLIGTGMLLDEEPP